MLIESYLLMTLACYVNFFFANFSTGGDRAGVILAVLSFSIIVLLPLISTYIIL